MCRVNGKTYLSYLLRLWRVRQNGFDVWRASLEDTSTRERRGFDGLKALLKFLESQTHEKISYVGKTRKRNMSRR
jgi:hypothetical protein